MEFKDKLVQYQNRINENLLSLFDTEKPTNLYEPMKYAVNIGGKRLRPILCEVVYSALGGKKKEKLYPALAIELLHNFTLVHDDIMDNDEKRRGMPTVHTKWDLATGVLSGDGVIALAYRVLLKEKFKQQDRIMNIFTDGLIEVCEGQGFDKEFETRTDVSEKEYLNMINNKTAALLAVPSQIGACCADADTKMIKLAGDYARAMGIAFQIQDDVLDIAGDEKLLGKTYGSDVQEGKKTYLYIKALEKLSGDVKQRFLEIIESKTTSREEILEVKKIYQDYGILEEAEKEVTKRINRAREILTSFPDKYDKSELNAFTDYLLNRKY